MAWHNYSSSRIEKEIKESPNSLLLYIETSPSASSCFFLSFLTPVSTVVLSLTTFPTFQRYSTRKLYQYSFNTKHYRKNDFIHALYPVFDRSQRRPKSDCLPVASRHRPAKPRRIHRWWSMKCRSVVLKLAGADPSPIIRTLQRPLMLLNARMADLTLWQPSQQLQPQLTRQLQSLVSTMMIAMTVDIQSL